MGGNGIARLATVFGLQQDIYVFYGAAACSHFEKGARHGAYHIA